MLAYQMAPYQRPEHEVVSPPHAKAPPKPDPVPLSPPAEQQLGESWWPACQ